MHKRGRGQRGGQDRDANAAKSGASKGRASKVRKPGRGPVALQEGSAQGGRVDKKPAKRQRPIGGRTTRHQDAPSGGQPSAPMRIARAMARAGLCSRREAERWVAEGRVSVNGRVLATPAVEVGPADNILVDGRPLPTAEPPRLWRYHKPRGLVTTHADPQGRATVFQKLPPELGRVISVGRLDFNTEGLLLLTNDGALARHMELPATGWMRRYRVRARGRVEAAQLEALKAGVEIDGVQYGPIEATIDTTQGANMWLSVAIREGKNREVRKVLASLGLEVSRLIRVSFGPFDLGGLTPGAVEPVKRRALAEAIGKEAAGQFGLSETAEARKERHARGGTSKPAEREAGQPQRGERR